MSIIKKAVIAALLFAAPSIAQASTGSGGYISNIVYSGSGQIYFQQSGSRDTVPGCASSNASNWAFDPTTAQGQAELSVLLTAYSLHKQVYVGGTSNCAANSSNIESVFYYYIIG